MTDRTPGFDTLAIHAGTAPDPATGARQVPIYQTTAFLLGSAERAAKLFNLQEIGYIYSRLTNPTVSALAERITALEGGVGGICCASGHGARVENSAPGSRVATVVPEAAASASKASGVSPSKAMAF